MISLVGEGPVVIDGLVGRCMDLNQVEHLGQWMDLEISKADGPFLLTMVVFRCIERLEKRTGFMLTVKLAPFFKLKE